MEKNLFFLGTSIVRTWEERERERREGGGGIKEAGQLSWSVEMPRGKLERDMESGVLPWRARKEVYSY